MSDVEDAVEVEDAGTELGEQARPDGVVEPGQRAVRRRRQHRRRRRP